MNCVFCNEEIGDYSAFRGAGTGGGQDFAHVECYEQKEMWKRFNYYLSFLSPSRNHGTLETARKALKYALSEDE